jgi:hypothetical protein
MQVDSAVWKFAIVEKCEVVHNVNHTNSIEKKVGGTKMSLKRLPGCFIAAFCGGAPPSLVEISGVGREVLEGVEPPEILQATKWRLWRIGGGFPVVKSVTRLSMNGSRRTSITVSNRSEISHVWASQRGETRMKVPFDVSSLFTTLLRIGIGGKAYARVKSHF